MNKIFKYELMESNRWLKLVLPKGHKVLHVDSQDGRMFLWAMVDDHSGPVEKEFILVGTGIDFDRIGFNKDQEYLGTFKCGVFIWHVFTKTGE